MKTIWLLQILCFGLPTLSFAQIPYAQLPTWEMRLREPEAKQTLNEIMLAVSRQSDSPESPIKLTQYLQHFFTRMKMGTLQFAPRNFTVPGNPTLLAKLEKNPRTRKIELYFYLPVARALQYKMPEEELRYYVSIVIAHQMIILQLAETQNLPLVADATSADQVQRAEAQAMANLVMEIIRPLEKAGKMKTPEFIGFSKSSQKLATTR